VIIGDNIRGGALVTMYAHGDTSNVTIPAVFTSHTTAHLLSSLIPSGGVFGDLALDDATRLSVASGEKPISSSAKEDSGSKAAKSSSKAVQKLDAGDGSSKNSPGGSQNSLRDDDKVDRDHARQGTDDPGWLRSLFSTSDESATSKDSRRPPSSGNIDWILQQDFNEDEQPSLRTFTTTSRSASTTKPTSGPRAKFQHDGFVIGVHDWRDPDLVDTTTVDSEEVANSSTESSMKNKHSTDPALPSGGSITPGSGEYNKGDHADRANHVLEKSTKKVDSSRQTDQESRGWMDTISWKDKTSQKPSTEAMRDRKGALLPVKAAEVTDTPKEEDSLPHEGLWVTLQPTSMSSSPFLDTLLVLVVSPLVTLTVVYALLLLRSRIRRRRWRAPKSVVERLPVRTYQTIASTTNSTNSTLTSRPGTPPTPNQATPLLHSSSRPIRQRPRSRTAGEVPTASTSFGQTASLAEVQEKREAALAEWKRKYGGKQRECVVCLEEYVDGVSRVMSLPCGHEFHAECM